MLAKEKRAFDFKSRMCLRRVLVLIELCYQGGIGMSIGVSVQTQKEIMFVNLTGELDQSTADKVKLRLMTALAAHDAKHIVFNLKALTFMDSSGIGIILGRYNQVESMGGRVFVLGMNPTVSKIFHMAGLNQIITVIDDESKIKEILEEAI